MDSLDIGIRNLQSNAKCERATRSMCYHRKQTRKAELFAFSCVLDAFRCQGDLDSEKMELLEALGKRFNISQYRHQQEMLRVSNDKFLNRVAENQKQQAAELNNLFSVQSATEPSKDEILEGNSSPQHQILLAKELEEISANAIRPISEIEYHFNDEDGNEAFEAEVCDVEDGHLGDSNSSLALPLGVNAQDYLQSNGLSPFTSRPYDEDDLILPLNGVDIKKDEPQTQLPNSNHTFPASPTSPTSPFDTLHPFDITKFDPNESPSSASPNEISPNGLSPTSPKVVSGEQVSANPSVMQNPIDSIDDFALEPQSFSGHFD
jgi:hypothetical protein